MQLTRLLALFVFQSIPHTLSRSHKGRKLWKIACRREVSALASNAQMGPQAAINNGERKKTKQQCNTFTHDCKVWSMNVEIQKNFWQKKTARPATLFRQSRPPAHNSNTSTTLVLETPVLTHRSPLLLVASFRFFAFFLFFIHCCLPGPFSLHQYIVMVCYVANSFAFQCLQRRKGLRVAERDEFRKKAATFVRGNSLVQKSAHIVQRLISCRCRRIAGAGQHIDAATKFGFAQIEADRSAGRRIVGRRFWPPLVGIALHARHSFWLNTPTTPNEPFATIDPSDSAISSAWSTTPPCPWSIRPNVPMWRRIRLSSGTGRAAM